MITTAGLQKLTRFSASDCSNYLHGRSNYVPMRRYVEIDRVAGLKHCELIEEHLSKYDTLTMAEALHLYGIGALSQRVGELNRRYERKGLARRIVNTGERGIGKHAIYKMDVGE